jgi:dihydrofolate reductase
MMRRLKLQMQMTVDGYVAGPNGEMDFMTWNWDDELNRYVGTLTEPVDCIVLGRKLAEGFIPYWASVAADPGHPEHSAGRTFTDTPKVVFSRTLRESPWSNTRLATGGLDDEITRLKSEAGSDIIAYGGAAFASALIRHGLIDEFHLLINPVAIGNGMAIFSEPGSRQELRLVKASQFACGVVALHYGVRS